MRNTSTRAFVGLALVATTAVSGCSNSRPGDGSVVSDVATVAPVSGTPSAEAKSPLTLYLDSLYGLNGSPKEQQQQRAAQQGKQEVLIGTCMKDAGFDYTPVPPVETVTGLDGPSEQDRDSKDWVSKFGYGLIQTPEGKTSDLDAGSKADGKAGKGNDPNRSYVESLTTSEKDAYDRAMYGENLGPAGGQEPDPQPSSDATYDWQKMGCMGSARHEVGQGQDPLKSAEGKIVDSAVIDFSAGMARWPGMAQLEAAWASCMSGKGYSGYHQQTDASAEIAAALNEPGGGNLPADLPGLARKERKMAMADLDCRSETNFRDTYQAITVAAETKFMKDNGPALDALKAAMEQAGHK